MPNNLSLTEAAHEIRAGHLSPLELTRACLAQIDTLDSTLKAWVTLDREGAEQQARKLQEELANGHDRGPLHGIPIGLKDIIYTKNMRTTGGSKILQDFVPEYDATATARLRRSGAILLGKTATTEYACFDPAETCNPWNPNHTPGGSSSGSAAAVAARMCPAALGSQTGGSISRPAAYCGTVGLKATHGRVSLHGVLPVSFSLDHVGPITRSVADAALLLQSIAGPDPQDPVSASVPTTDYRVRPPARPPRIGLLRSYFLETASSDMQTATEQAAHTLQSAGAQIQNVELPDSFASVHQLHRILMIAEAAEYHAEQFQTRREDYRPGLRSMIEEGLTLSAVDYARARYHQLRFKSEIRSAFSNVDLLLTPATPAPAPEGLASTGNPAFNSPWSYAGLPTVVLPVALSPQGLPIAIQLIAPAFSETDLLCAAHWCEVHLSWNQSPTLLKQNGTL